MRKRLTAFLFCLLACFAHSQTFSPYQNITTGNGLPSNYVLAVTEDENGFLWIGTDKGLCRYDGFRWQVWDKDNGLLGNYVTQVFADKRGGLWLSISGKGGFHFDIKTGRAQALNHDGFNPFSMQADADGNLFVEGAHNGHRGGFVIRPEALNAPLPVVEMAGTEPVRLFNRPDKKKVLCLWQAEGECERAKRFYKGVWPLQLVKIPPGIEEDIRYASDSVIVTATHYYGFTKKGELKKSLLLFGLPNSYAFTCETANGLYVYNVKNGYHFINGQNKNTLYNEATGLGTDFVNKIFQTRDGTVVIATLGAGLQLIKQAYRKAFAVESGPVRTVLPSADGWYVQAGNNFFKTSVGQRELRLLGRSNNTVFTLYKTTDTLIAGSLKGFQFYKQRGDVLTPLSFVEFNSGVSSIIRTANGFAAGSYGNGTVFFNTKKVATERSDTKLHIVEKLYQAANGYAALSYEDGLTLVDTVTHRRTQFTQANGLLSNSVYSLRQKGDTLWTGTKGGVTVLVENKVVNSMRLAGGHEGERVLCCFADKAAAFWAVTNAGLYRLRDGWLKPVGSHPLIASDDVITAAAYDEEKSELAIGSNKTFSVVSMDVITLSSEVAPPVLTQQAVDGRADSSSKLPYNFSSLHFTLSPGAVSPFARSRFYYKLQGLDNGWHELKDSVAISFSGLRPGAYKLWAKAVNADGYESSETVLSSFTVQRPFWARWPFLLLCGVLVVLITALVVRRIERGKQRRREATLLLQRTLQAERERIAKDLHDHLGTNLTTIIAQTDNIETRLYRGEAAQAANTVQRLSAHTRETMNVLRETIWAVQETEHSLEHFMVRVRSFLQRFFESTAIEWELIDSTETAIVLSPAQTLHLFRIVQEASQNILKHAGATRASYSLSISERQLQIVIEDNGRGTNGSPSFNNGLTNIQERARQLGGEASITTQPSVKIAVSIPIQERIIGY